MHRGKEHFNTEHLFPASKMRVKYKGNETAVGMMSFSPWGFVGWQRNGLVGAQFVGQK